MLQKQEFEIMIDIRRFGVNASTTGNPCFRGQTTFGIGMGKGFEAQGGASGPSHSEHGSALKRHLGIVVVARVSKDDAFFSLLN